MALVTRVWPATIALLLAGAGCDQPPYIPPYEAPPTDTGGPDECDIQPTLSSLKQEYFGGSCVFSGCHDDRSEEGGLNLEIADLHAQLVGVSAEDEFARGRGKLRVKAGDPDASFMVQKVEGTMERDEGAMMPDGTDEPIDPECRIKMLRQWIADGALDN